MYKIRGADKKEYGPVSGEQLRQWLREGRANADTMVQVEGSEAWQALGTLPEFAPTAGAATFSAAQGPLGPHGLAVTSLILGGVSLMMTCCCYGLPFNILGLIFGIIALVQIKARPERYTGRGMAIAGIILSCVSLAVGVMLFIFGVAMSWPDIQREFRKI